MEWTTPQIEGIMFYLASIDKDKMVVEILSHVHEDTMEEPQAIATLKMLTGFKVHDQWEHLEKRGFKIIKLKEF